MPAPVSVFLVDDHPLVLSALESCLARTDDLQVVGTAGSGRRAIEGVSATHPDVVLVDYVLPDMTGAQVCAAVTATANPPRVVALTSSDTAGVVNEFVRAGCSGFLVKDAQPAAVVDALRTVAAGSVWFDPRVLVRLGEIDTSDAPITLTERELETLHQMAQGRTYLEIARDMHVSRGTVKNQVSSLLLKLNASRRSEAIAIAARRGLL